MIPVVTAVSYSNEHTFSKRTWPALTGLPGSASEAAPIRITLPAAPYFALERV